MGHVVGFLGDGSTATAGEDGLTANRQRGWTGETDECDERINCLTLSDDRGDEPSSVRRPPLGHR